MTIKRRLFWSNILMLVIPVLFAPLLAFTITTLMLNAVAQDAGYQVENPQQLFALRNDLLKQADTLLRLPPEQRQPYLEGLERAIANDTMQLEIYQAGSSQPLYRFGQKEGPYHDQLLVAMAALGGSGTVSLDRHELYSQQLHAGGQTYQLNLFSVQPWGDFRSARSMMMFTSVLVMISMFLVILLTNRLLTRFVFRKIARPLDILANGVHQIRDGNLEYRIHYTPQDEFAPICEDFNAMASRLKYSVELSEKQSEDKKQLLAGISHDLRSPLTSIRAYVEGLLDGVAQTPEARARYMRMIKTKAEEIDHMVAKLFLFSKMDLGDFPYAPELLELNQEITALVAATNEDYARQGLQVTITSLAPDVTIQADPDLLRSVFSNILENSLKYKSAPQGNVWIKSSVKANHVWLSIEDDGPGVPEEALDKLFDVFYRNDPSRNNPQQGSGLGLAITAKAIQAMQGHIHAENRQGGGLRIIIRLPLARKDNTHA